MSLTIAEVTKRSHETATEKGWWADYEQQDLLISSKLMLIVSEVSEALEELRRKGMEGIDNLWFSGGEDEKAKPEGFVVELADVIIRVADLCREYNLDLETALITKMKYNKTRPHRHGGKTL